MLSGSSCTPARSERGKLLTNGATPALRYGDASLAGVTYDGPGFRTVTLGFGLASVGSENDRATLVARIFDWFDAPTGVAETCWAEIKARYRSR